MEPYHRGREGDLYCGHVLDVLGSLPDGSAQTGVTSPPYWGLRDYGVPGVAWSAVRFAPMAGLPDVEVPAWTGCLGLEPEPLAFVGHLVHVFRAVRRVLKDDGTLWLNLGDSYAQSEIRHRNGQGTRQTECRGGLTSGSTEWNEATAQVGRKPNTGLAPKNLLGIPWRVAFALQADGWWLRSDVIWAKPNPMPESVTDRPTKAHEYVFLLAKSPKYFYDAGAVREPATSPFGRGVIGRGSQGSAQAVGCGGRRPQQDHSGWMGGDGETRNLRSVWTITPKPYRGAHFATMPPDLARTCILAGSRPGDIVLDPFNGSGTTGLVAGELGRRYVGSELNEDYCRLSIERWRQGGAQAPLALEVG